MLCKYCPLAAVGINYRPNASLDNIPTCRNHATSLFISFSASHSQQHQKHSSTKLQELLQKLMDSMVAEFNLIKCEVLYHEEQMSKLTQLNAINYRMNCELTSPYIVIAADEELLLSTLIKRIKFRYEKQKVENERKWLYNSRIIQNEQKLQRGSLKPNQAKSLLFFTPQSTDRSRLEDSNVKKLNIFQISSTVSQPKRSNIGEERA